MEAKQITIAFKTNGNSYSLMSDTPNALLWRGQTPSGSEFFEVWEKRFSKKDKKIAGGNIVPAGSQLRPGNEDFGAWAWSFYSVNRALQKLDVLNHTRAEKLSKTA